MLERLGRLFDGFGPTDRKILAVYFLCFTVASDFVTGLVPTFILYVLCVAWCSNYIGGRFATVLALMAAFFPYRGAGKHSPELPPAVVSECRRHLPDP
jgi:hypothetical protein